MTVTTRDGAARTSSRSNLYRRTFDIVVSALLAVITLPIVLVAILGSALALRAWPLFVQERVGCDGEPFRFVKVRTLPTSVPAYVDKFQLEQHRIPAFCRLLRSLHLDELPQLYLVLAGRMSLVGPRPEMAHLHAQMPVRFAQQRTTVRPGCTGLWQVSESCTGLISGAPEYDRYYLTHRSLRLDLWVLYRTALKMTGVAGPISLAEVPAWTLAPAQVAALRTIDLRTTEVHTIDLRTSEAESAELRGDVAVQTAAAGS